MMGDKDREAIGKQREMEESWVRNTYEGGEGEGLVNRFCIIFLSDNFIQNFYCNIIKVVIWIANPGCIIRDNLKYHLKNILNTLIQITTLNCQQSR